MFSSLSFRLWLSYALIIVTALDIVRVAHSFDARIFDRFHQSDPARRCGEKHGSRLGLAIAKEIVQAHGGRIGVLAAWAKGQPSRCFCR
jgi:signal transduction histidine kinase